MQSAIGIDIGGTRTKIGLISLDDHSVVEKIIIPTETRSETNFLGNLDIAIESLRQQASALGSSIEGIGIGVPSFVNAGGLVDSTYGFLEFMEDYPLVAVISERYRLPCRIDNDARVVALGEARFGSGQPFERVLVLTLGTGLGVGFTSGGRFVDALPFGHMAGHQSIVPDGSKCYCGKKGCLESLVSVTGLLELAESAGWQEAYPAVGMFPEKIFTAAAQGNLLAEVIVEKYLAYLKTGIDNFINILAPDAIVLAGGLSKSLRPYLPQLSLLSYLKPFRAYTVQILVSDLEEAAGMLGGAALFME